MKTTPKPTRLAYEQEAHLIAMMAMARKRFRENEGQDMTPEQLKELRAEFIKLIEAEKKAKRKLRRRPRGASAGPIGNAGGPSAN